MSGSPKYSAAELERQRQEQLERERQRKAAEEARLRREAEERERKRRLESCRQNLKQQQQTLVTDLQNNSNLAYAQDVSNLQKRCQQLETQINNATTESQLQQMTPELTKITQDWENAKLQKWRDDEEKKRQAEIDKQQSALEGLERRLNQVSDLEKQKFDLTGLNAVKQAIEQTKNLLYQGNPQAVRQPLADATTKVENHLKTVLQNRAIWQQRKAKAETNLGEIQGIIAGLQADPVVMRWQASEVASLQQYQQQGERVIIAETFEDTENFLNIVKSQSEAIVNTANQAQLKADQRDYIASSIVESLQEMGFTITYNEAEYPEHPASATIIGAATNSGKGISVSIPVEGEVFYDVEGYSKQTVASVGGGSAAICDEAEQVIGEMHQVLGDKFGVKMSELNWEGKDPQRQLRKADSLPHNPKSRGFAQS
jgi:DNA repair exonuclease SbcCD ATPase subunit